MSVSKMKLATTEKRRLLFLIVSALSFTFGLNSGAAQAELSKPIESAQKATAPQNTTSNTSASDTATGATTGTTTGTGASGTTAESKTAADLANPTDKGSKVESKEEAKPADKAVDKTSDKSDDKSGEKSAKTGKRSKNPFPDVLPCLTYVDPDKDPTAILVCVHGLGLNSASYKDFGETMSKRGYLVYAVDMPGFGSFKKATEGRDRVDFDYCMRGLVDTLKFIHKANPRLPLFILGESMGGAIALRFTAENPAMVNGLISSVPSGDRFNQSKEALKVGLKLLTAPNKKFDIGTSIIEKATQDCALRTRWAGDPLNRMDLSPKELVQFQNFMNDNFEAAKKINTTPVLFVQGCKDKLVRPKGTEELFNALNTEDRKYELIDDGEHLIFEEGQFKEEVIKTVDAWLAAHIASSKQIGSK